jgi:hypothetical protein
MVLYSFNTITGHFDIITEFQSTFNNSTLDDIRTFEFGATTER